MTRRVLYQFPVSHYCEKIRWVLEHKGLAYGVNNQLPGVHRLVTRRLAAHDTVPVLVDGQHAIGNSSDIALYLDDQYPEPELIPREPAARAEVLALEAYFDEGAGPAVRQFVYSHLVRSPRTLQQVVLADHGPLVRAGGRALAPLLARGIAAVYAARDEKLAACLEVIHAAAARIEALTEGRPDRHLLGPALTLADITAAALLAPMLQPPESPWKLPVLLPALAAERARLHARPAGQWVLARYREERRRS